MPASALAAAPAGAGDARENFASARGALNKGLRITPLRLTAPQAGHYTLDFGGRAWLSPFRTGICM